MTTKRETDSPVAESAKSTIASFLPKFAHDMKKPFSQISMALELLDGVQDLARLRKVMDTVRPGIEREIGNANAMLRDLALIAGTEPAVAATVSVDDLFQSIGDEAQAAASGNQISFQWETVLEHEGRLRCDPSQLSHAAASAVLILTQGLRGNVKVRLAWIDGDKGAANMGRLILSTDSGKAGSGIQELKQTNDPFTTAITSWQPIRWAAIKAFVHSMAGTAGMTDHSIWMDLPSAW